ncbi:MAG: MlaD family protein [Calditrichia bacterium]
MQIHSQKYRFGIFIIVSSIAILIFLAIITSQKFLKKEDIYYIAYEDVSVSGLEVGSPVKYLGINVGSVEAIQIDPHNVNRVLITVTLEKDTPIKKDARADIASIGITGLKMIEIRGGTNDAPLLKTGGFIRAGTSTTAQITGKAEIIANKLEQVLNNISVFTQPQNMNKIIHTVDEISRTFNNMNQILSENRENLKSTILISTRAAAQLDSMSARLNFTSRRLEQIVSSDTVRDILVNTHDISMQLKKANLVDLIRQMGTMIERTNVILSQVDSDLSEGSDTFNQSMEKLQESLENLDAATRLISQDPSVLIRGTKPAEIPDKNLEP